MLRTFPRLRPLLKSVPLFTSLFSLLSSPNSIGDQATARRPSIRFTRLKFQRSCSVSATKMENCDDSKKIGVSTINPDSQSRGALVVLEGLDRSGKSSQCSELLSHLQNVGCPVELWRFPDRNTAVGQMISAYLSNQSNLDDHTIHLLFSTNRWEKRSLMEDKLKAGITLIVDRYSYSGVAFSSAKGLDFDWCKAPEMGLLAPDMVLYLDISPEKAAERGGYGNERYEHLDFQEKVRAKYQALHDPSWKIVDACLSMEEVQKKLREYVLDCVAACQNGKTLSHLWLH